MLHLPFVVFLPPPPCLICPLLCPLVCTSLPSLSPSPAARPPPAAWARVQVLIANERMSTNHVYCFKKRQPSKFLWTSEIRSFVDNSGRPPSSMYLQMYAKVRAERTARWECGMVLGGCLTVWRWWRGVLRGMETCSTRSGERYAHGVRRGRAASRDGTIRYDTVRYGAVRCGVVQQRRASVVPGTCTNWCQVAHLKLFFGVFVERLVVAEVIDDPEPKAWFLSLSNSPRFAIWLHELAPGCVQSGCLALSKLTSSPFDYLRKDGTAWLAEFARRSTHPL